MLMRRDILNRLAHVDVGVGGTMAPQSVCLALDHLDIESSTLTNHEVTRPLTLYKLLLTTA